MRRALLLFVTVFAACDPVIDIVQQLLGHKRQFVTAMAHVANGTHTTFAR